jgi:hypothetical protein
VTKRPLLVLACLFLTYASLAQGVGWNQNAHYALVRALADGTAAIDPYREETGDVSWMDGHYYAAKAPGLAFATLPVYLVLDTLGLKDAMARAPGAANEQVGMLWALGLVGCVTPAVAIAWLVRRAGGEVAPGAGLIAAVSLGLGTLLLPFATLFFSHVLAAALAFGAFVLLWLRPRLALVAGVLAGLSVTVDYPLALAALVVGVHSLTRGFARAAAYAAGAVAGILPLLAYQWWAFGSPFQVAYEEAVLVGGASGHDVLGANASGFFGVSTPSFPTAVELLFAPIGLLRLSPVLAAAAVGIVLLYRRRYRAEAGLVAAVALGYLVYNSGYYQPFGGFVPGPRFLLPLVPFLGVPLALAFSRLPLTTTALALVSIALMAAVTLTGPLLAFDNRWHERLLDGWFGGRGWPTIVPFAVLLAATVGLAWREQPLPLAWSEAPLAAGALGGWALLWLVAPSKLEGWSIGAAFAVAALAALVTAAVVAGGTRVATARVR